LHDRFFFPKFSGFCMSRSFNRSPLSRRVFLRGAGVALGLPLLDAMTPAFARTVVINGDLGSAFNTTMGSA
jgi:hypothetical protein